jgi:hypothetical protein
MSCKFGIHCRRKDCKFDHPKDWDYTKNIESYKTVICKHYEQTGKCPYNEKCNFAHGQYELRNDESSNDESGKDNVHKAKNVPNLHNKTDFPDLLPLCVSRRWADDQSDDEQDNDNDETIIKEAVKIAISMKKSDTNKYIKEYILELTDFIQMYEKKSILANKYSEDFWKRELNHFKALKKMTF